MDNDNGRKRSQTVPAILLSSLAATIVAGCSSIGYSTAVQRCVDDDGTVRDDKDCMPGSGVHSHPGAGGYWYPRFVYGGTGEGKVGSKIKGFSHAVPEGTRIVNSSGRTLVKGGFGGGRSGGFGG